MKTLLKLLLIPAFFAFALNAGAEQVDSGDKGNGGDDVGVEFAESFNTAVEFIRNSQPDLYAKISDPEKITENVKVITVSKTLRLEVAGAVQEVVAINKKSNRTIQVNRRRWAAITNPYVKEAIALHEFLSLKGLESTGDYLFSAQYLSARKLDTSVLLSGAASLAGDFKMDVLRSSPEYAKAILALTAREKKSSYSTTLISLRVKCAHSGGPRCTEGSAFYELQLNGNDNDGAFEFVNLGVISAQIDFVDDPEAETVGAWVVELKTRKK